MRAGGPRGVGYRVRTLAASAVVGLFLLALGVLVFLRVRHVDAAFGAAFGCQGCLTGSVLIHDLPYVSGVLACLILGVWVRARWLGGACRLLALLGLLVYGLDIAVSQQLFTRLHAADVMVFAAQPAVLQSHLINTGLLHWPVLLALGVLVAGFLVLPAGRGGRRGAMALVVPLGLATAGFGMDPGQYVHDWALRNVVSVNFNTGVSRPYRNAPGPEVDTPAAIECAPGENVRPDVVILILESWSPYQSALFGGIHDWTPSLDRIGREGSYFTRMHASGFTTNDGLMGLLTGMELLSPVKPFFSSMPFETTWGQSRTLPKLLGERGYDTAFFTSGNLAFTEKGRWLKDIGFAHVEGHDHPSYEGHPRMHFDAVPDEVLYARVLDYLSQGPSTGPRLVVIESVSSHHPFIHPYTKAHDEEAVFRYMDQAAAAFHAALVERGFLEQGQLLIVSDHRAMIPVRAEEREVFGRATLSRIPAIWVGEAIRERGEVATPFHQADVIDTFDWMTAESVCTDKGRRDLTRPALTRPRCLYHGRGDNRDLVDVFCPQGEGTIRLAGDDTAMDEWSPAGAPGAEQAVAWLNRYRIERDRHHDQWKQAQDR
ncbi:LTA synthase family protein [Parazoarcus communis]|uniref:Sulfatase N-terminal domain-containing protein n=1 Tax=Parazoarcus communis SWub3 = DSM 12120 TaxID=1121029 RepID=A0A323V7P1_9RHOO|nr:sulfatase-like hydrolase/transferase [Parazoarcus communis]NMG70936.1 sulfatase-like hydrolase/transferase [Parazoarcus communis SWub3 = DSM 12120]PZA16178.1 hypothetical protein DNK49_12740 [Azoarcus communis] [Parazoarcus communis SWub3 = DSM 12120]